MKKDRMFWAGLAMLAVFGGCAHDDLAPLSLVSAKEVSEQKKQDDAAKAATAAEGAVQEAVPAPSPSPAASV